MRASEISKLLGQQAEAVVRELLPQGKRSGHEWRVGSLSGEPGESLAVHIGGEKSGVWSDFSSGDKGDFIGLWMRVRDLSLADACSEALAFMGIREDRRPPERAREWKRPERAGVSKLSPEHTTWLQDVRKLPASSIAAYKLASRGERLMFPYLLGDDLIFAKYRKLPKQFSADAECEPILFGWQAISPNSRAVCITEGEMDAIAMHAYGFPSLSVPTGAGAHGWIEREFDRLERFDTIYLAMDDDPAGQKAIPELVERLGRERTRIVTLPRKDANECLMEGVSRDDVIASMRDARTRDPEELRNVGDFEDAVMLEYDRVDDGMCLPWPKTHGLIKLRAGETSIWAGVSGHGKSVLMTNVVGYLASHGTRCCVASMEFRTSMWLNRMNRQMSGVEKPTDAFGRHINRELARVMYAFDVSGRAKAQRILEVFRYSRRRYETELFVIDNLTKCGFDEDDYSGQKTFIEDLTDFARETSTHVAVIAHMRKGDGEDKPAGKSGVKGSGGITDMCDTSIEIWRNKPRERAIRAAHEAREEVPEKFAKQADTLLLVNKQRATGKEPVIHLWFDQTSTQFLSGPNQTARSLVQYSATSAEQAA